MDTQPTIPCHCPHCSGRPRVKRLLVINADRNHPDIQAMLCTGALKDEGGKLVLEWLV